MVAKSDPAVTIVGVEKLVLRIVRREPTLDGVDIFRRLDRPSPEGVVSDPARIGAVVDALRDSVGHALQTPSIVRGWRAQALFASMVAALDGCLLMTQVDLGEMYADDQESVKAPDYFLHLRGGERLLVDVKSFTINASNPNSPIKLGAREAERMRRFGELFGAEVYIAVYVRSMLIWLLVPLSEFELGPGGGFRITLTRAMLRNRMAMIGDHMVGTVYPIEIRMTPHVDYANYLAEDGSLNMTTGSIRIFAAGVEATALADKNLLYFFMRYGGWRASQSVEMDGARVRMVHAKVEPYEVSDQGFEIIGTMAGMYARLFEQETTTEEDAVRSLDFHSEPGMLSTLLPHDYKSDVVPIWRFVVQPERGAGDAG